jgi:hypothetical protein
MTLPQFSRIATRGLSATQSITQNPFTFVGDTIIRLLVKIIVPVPPEATTCVGSYVARRT